MSTHTGDRAKTGVRLAILDDNPFVRDPDGAIRPRAALFHRFAEEVVRAASLDQADYLVPVAELGPGEPPSALDPIDSSRLRVVPTAPFHGIAGYLRGIARLTRANWPVLRSTIGAADLLWIKAPASNALLAAIACRRAGTPRFTWVAGSARAVVAGQARGPLGSVAPRAAAVAYDGVTRILERTGPSIRLDADLFTSVLRAEDLAPQAEPAPRSNGLLRLVWAGRMRPDKGLDDLVAATARLRAGGRDVELDLIGDGPARGDVESRVAQHGLTAHVRWHGYVGDRAAYLAALAAGDVFVLPSRAEGVPKAAVEAMAAGVPVVATDVGAVADLLGNGLRGVVVAPDDPPRLADAIAALADDPATRSRLRSAGLVFAAGHTMEAQAVRLVAWMRDRFPALHWPAGDDR